MAAGSGVRVPAKASGLYRAAGRGGRPLSRADWSKALSWAVTVETLQQRQGELLGRRRQQGARSEEAAGLEGGTRGTGSGGTSGDGVLRPGRPGSMRRAASASAAAAGLESHGRVHEPLLPASGSTARVGLLYNSSSTLASAFSSLALLTDLLHPLRAASAALSLAVALPWAALRGAVHAALRLLPWAPPANAGEEPWERGEAEDTELEALIQRESLTGLLGGGDLTPVGGGGALEGAAAAAAAAARASSSASSAGGTLVLSEQSVRYGLGMLQASGGSLRQAVSPDNPYERQLLGEVLVPEECGAGFSEVREQRRRLQLLRG